MAPPNCGNQQNAINLYNVPVLKTTCDEQLVTILSTLGYSVSHTMTDVRLAIGYASIVVAGVTAFIDYKWGFFDAKLLITICVVLYAVLNFAYTYWVWAIEKGVVYSGTRNKNSSNTTTDSSTSTAAKTSTITISTTKGTAKSKYDPVYEVTVKLVLPDNSKYSLTKSSAFNEFFATNGYIVFDKFEKWVASAVAETESLVLNKMK